MNLFFILGFISFESYLDITDFTILFSSVVPIRVYSNVDLNKEEIIRDNRNKSGVYQFTNLLTGTFYVGSSTNLSKKFSQYFNYNFISSPARGKSIIYSSLLHNGYSNFSLIILEYCELKDLLGREQFYIDVIKPTMNILPIVGNSLSYKHTLDNLEKMSLLKKRSVFRSR